MVAHDDDGGEMLTVKTTHTYTVFKIYFFPAQKFYKNEIKRVFFSVCAIAQKSLKDFIDVFSSSRFFRNKEMRFFLQKKYIYLNY